MTVNGSVLPDTTLVTTGIPSLDEILHGGLVPCRIYLVEGSPGSGKTTLALQYLLEGVRRGERCLYIMLSETKVEIEAIAYLTKTATPESLIAAVRARQPVT